MELARKSHRWGRVSRESGDKLLRGSRGEVDKNFVPDGLDNIDIHRIWDGRSNHLPMNMFGTNPEHERLSFDSAGEFFCSAWKGKREIRPFLVERRPGTAIDSSCEKIHRRTSD